MTIDMPDAAIAMNHMYRRQRHVYDLTRKYYLLGRDRLIDRLEIRPCQGALEIGCGTARNLIVAARRYPAAQLFGLDVSSEMLATAQTAIGRAALTSRIRLAQTDVMALDARAAFGRPGFERVFLSYTLSMVPDWRGAVDAALTLLCPGGELHIVDFGRQQQLPQWLGAGLRRWLAAFDVIPCDALFAHLGDRAQRWQAQIATDDLYLGYAQYAVLMMPPRP